ncbi:hypothetical protein JK191_02045 [Gluconobacter sphaericus]|uniref:hypothetical protein n=1 Tax=Gluconobacter sphaericus TaxID=574987 RepID=UPI001B8C7C4A|nr:hypothetical protein [Gluconobacter sphaericus]MBS1096372.1 hypothetical protein [Gluconobacter sphaericus]
MNLSQKIAEYGAEAVSYYAKMAKLRNDNEVREEFVSAQIAMKFFERDGLTTHVERDYLTIVRELGGEITLQDNSSMRGQRADVAIYGLDGLPHAIIEVKICDEGDRRGGEVIKDFEKISILRSKIGVDTYIAILMTDINDREICSARRKTFEENLESSFSGASDLIRSQDGEWEWQFLAGKF